MVTFYSSLNVYTFFDSPGTSYGFPQTVVLKIIIIAELLIVVLISPTSLRNNNNQIKMWIIYLSHSDIFWTCKNSKPRVLLICMER